MSISVSWVCILALFLHPGCVAFAAALASVPMVYIGKDFLWHLYIPRRRWLMALAVPMGSVSWPTLGRITPGGARRLVRVWLSPSGVAALASQSESKNDFSSSGPRFLAPLPNKMARVGAGRAVWWCQQSGLVPAEAVWPRPRDVMVAKPE